MASSASRPTPRVLSLRQTSDNFQPVGAPHDPNDPNTTQTAGSLRSLARSIVHAANLGAQVINISEAACYKITRPIDERSLGAAIEYAVIIKGVVIVVAAGNTRADCAQNPPPDPSVPSDPRGWQRVQTIVSPAWYSPLVLTVGGIGQNRPAEQLLDVGAVGRCRRARRERRRARVRRQPGQRLPGPRTGRFRSTARRSPPPTSQAWPRCCVQRFPDLTPAQIKLPDHRDGATSRWRRGQLRRRRGRSIPSPR